ncbi:CLUMA_CG015474, isoform A [Clunio marinus]|uniref:CLUMA_CG015474, isoform A n=1 Tax=Clunio marinus TaxID=568069 RepID=A0A1J1IS31_9DIPT|nr:CLUMA_CG015474, isoform A [Clunio marinus]
MEFIHPEIMFIILSFILKDECLKASFSKSSNKIACGKLAHIYLYKVEDCVYDLFETWCQLRKIVKLAHILNKGQHLRLSGNESNNFHLLRSQNSKDKSTRHSYCELKSPLTTLKMLN